MTMEQNQIWWNHTADFLRTESETEESTRYLKQQSLHKGQAFKQVLLKGFYILCRFLIRHSPHECSLSFVLPKQCASAHGSCSCQPWSPPSEPTPGRSDSMVCLGFYIIFHMCVPIVLTLISVCVQHMFYWTEWWLWAIIWSKKESYKIRPDGNNQGSTIKKAFIHIVAILPESEPDIEIRFRIIQILSLS